MKTVDVIIPIYNSYEETKNCIESVLKYTNIIDYNIYLLDDRSPDERIIDLTNSYAEKYKHITAIRNNQNLGFPENVNNGFRLTENDVVILNSDTIVTENWLSSLQEKANTQSMIAAVIPMSNYGNISGLPTTNMMINDLFSMEEMIQAFQNSKENNLIEVPLVIGFCMYMKRKAINDVGYFDSETFKRGYGEETDWCMRARSKGYKLAVDQESYVHHIGGISFGEEKETLRKNSKKILLERYPNIDHELLLFDKANSHKRLRAAMMKELRFLQKQAPLKLKLKMIKHYLVNRF